MGSVFFRLTRNADLDHGEEDMEDLLESIAEQLKARRFAQVVRLEHVTTANVSMIEMLKAELGLQQADIYEQAVDLDFSVLNPIWELGHKQLRYRSWVPVVSEALKDEKVSIFSVIRNQDILVHHPYESFSQSVERFVSAAVNDRHVLAIKMVLYRTGVDSPFITHLIRAAELGKQVVCIVELKARFDEESNIQVARRLERAGVHVVYGVVGLKTHCKVTLVVRAEGEQVRSYAHISTGNYNVNTAEVYTDLGLFTANPVLTRDTIQLFHYLTGGSPETHFEKLVLGPLHMKQKFFDLIEFERSQAEQGRPARIMAKMNSLEDPEVIQSLYLASQAGVKISLIVRGFCCLKPGVAGLSENISVVSVVGRFLEHSRVFYFQNGQSTFEEGVLLMGSADWMLRNLNSRVEILAPIEAIDIKRRILELFKLMLEDQRQAWDLLPDGSYIQRRPGSISEEEGVHDRLMKVYATLESLAIR
jgi:polyphosphate kinase